MTTRFTISSVRTKTASGDAAPVALGRGAVAYQATATGSWVEMTGASQLGTIAGQDLILDVLATSADILFAVGPATTGDGAGNGIWRVQNGDRMQVGLLPADRVWLKTP